MGVYVLLLNERENGREVRGHSKRNHDSGYDAHRVNDDGYVRAVHECDNAHDVLLNEPKRRIPLVP